MGFCTNELLLAAEQEDGHTFGVSIETGMHGLARLNVTCWKPGSDEAHNSQGADLTAAECRAFAQMLLATAELVDE